MTTTTIRKARERGMANHGWLIGIMNHRHEVFE